MLSICFVKIAPPGELRSLLYEAPVAKKICRQFVIHLSVQKVNVQYLNVFFELCQVKILFFI